MKNMANFESRKLFVNKIPNDCDEGDLENVFGKFDKIEECVIKQSPDGNRRFAFIHFSSLHGAQSVVDANPHYVLNNRVHAQFAKKNEDKPNCRQEIRQSCNDANRNVSPFSDENWDTSPVRLQRRKTRTPDTVVNLGRSDTKVQNGKNEPNNLRANRSERSDSGSVKSTRIRYRERCCETRNERRSRSPYIEREVNKRRFPPRDYYKHRHFNGHVSPREDVKQYYLPFGVRKGRDSFWTKLERTCSRDDDLRFHRGSFYDRRSYIEALQKLQRRHASNIVKLGTAMQSSVELMTMISAFVEYQIR
ncbi:hypothetical protein ACOME3_000321 [Neoechinorhynchus agilis]